MFMKELNNSDVEGHQRLLLLIASNPPNSISMPRWCPINHVYGYRISSLRVILEFWQVPIRNPDKGDADLMWISGIWFTPLFRFQMMAGLCTLYGVCLVWWILVANRPAKSWNDCSGCSFAWRGRPSLAEQITASSYGLCKRNYSIYPKEEKYLAADYWVEISPKHLIIK